MISSQLRCVRKQSSLTQNRQIASSEVEERVVFTVTFEQIPDAQTDGYIYRANYEFYLTEAEANRFVIGQTYNMNVLERTDNALRQQILGRLSDIVRRSEVTDAESLLYEIEQRLR